MWIWPKRLMSGLEAWNFPSVMSAHENQQPIQHFGSGPPLATELLALLHDWRRHAMLVYQISRPVPLLLLESQAVYGRHQSYM